MSFQNVMLHGIADGNPEELTAGAVQHHPEPCGRAIGSKDGPNIVHWRPPKFCYGHVRSLSGQLHVVHDELVQGQNQPLALLHLPSSQPLHSIR